ncbi:MAG: nitroreductase family protein [Pseudomonadota bacterium]|nr:nitroreductase family protein [Pseudomonadota bacterium]
MSGDDSSTVLTRSLALRFGDWRGEIPSVIAQDNNLASLAGRRSHRKFRPEAVDAKLVETLCALALCAPSKSDLQQRDIIIVEDANIRRGLNAIVADQPWVADAPNFLVFCGNNRRQRQIHQWRGHHFVNDHLDAYFNAAVDAGIALAEFMTAAEAIGLGCCPVSGIRNDSQRVCDILALPDHVFSVAGLALGWPSEEGLLSPRLPLAATVHRDRFDETRIRELVEAYDRHRNSIKPFREQRFVEDFGSSDSYGWSEDKARQYSRPERADFGEFIRSKGFDLK